MDVQTRWRWQGKWRILKCSLCWQNYICLHGKYFISCVSSGGNTGSFYMTVSWGITETQRLRRYEEKMWRTRNFYFQLWFWSTHNNVFALGCALKILVQLDDLDGEIDLASCVNVSDCEVEKNYGLQIQVRATLLAYLIECFGHCVEVHSNPTPPPPPTTSSITCFLFNCVCVCLLISCRQREQCSLSLLWPLKYSRTGWSY